MKVLFEFSRGGLIRYRPYIEKVREIISESGNQLTNDLLSDTNNQGNVFSQKIFIKLCQSIEKSDCVIIEGSVISLSIGYVFSQAIRLGKPVLYLYHEETSENRVRFIKAIQTDLLKIKEYHSVGELESYINDFFANHKLIKTRFNLVLPNELNSFVTSESEKLRISKTEYILQLIRVKKED